MSCVGFEAVVALWSDDLDATEVERVEAHIFACDACAAASERLGRLVEALRFSVLPPVISHAHRDRLVASGMRITMTIVDPNIEAHARFAPELDLLVHVLRADVARAEQVDVDLVAGDVPQISFTHVPFDRERGEVLIACQRHYEHFPFAPIFRIHAVEGGVRRRIGDYTIHHEWR